MGQNENISSEFERKKLEKSCSLHWFHWVIVSFSLLITFFAWYFSKTQLKQKVDVQFERQATQVIELIIERMQKYEDALWGGVALIQAYGGDVNFDQWREYASSIRIEEKYPGINGIGVIHALEKHQVSSYLEEQQTSRPQYYIHPEHEGDAYYPISYIIPVKGNEKAVGLDMAHEANRYSAAKKSRDSGAAQITGPITLVQDSGRTPGFLFYAPFYQGGFYNSLEQRRAHFTGMVYAPFVVKKLMQGVLAKQNRQVGIRISDKEEVLYDEHNHTFDDFDADPLYRKELVYNLYGQNWSFDIWSANSFRAAAENHQPKTILIAGITIDCLLIALFVFISRGSRQALFFADRITRELRNKATDLEKSNQELENFSYVASHDLKTPLRAIKNRALWVVEDSEERLTEESQEHLNKLQGSILRMEALLDDLLEYARVSQEESELNVVDTTELVHDVVELLSPPEGVQVDIGALPKLYTIKTPLYRVFSNLIGNAIKYHHQPEKAHVKVTATQTNSLVTFSVEDDGPGIEKKYHERIFKVFQRLQGNEEIMGTGIGLSIVKKSVEQYGGTVSLTSNEGKGCLFSFTWPKKN